MLQAEAAERCFALASAYAGETIAPGALALPERDDDEMTFEKLAAECARTAPADAVASVLAEEALRHVEDEGLRRALAALAEVHRRRVELVFDVARWCAESAPQLHLSNVLLSAADTSTVAVLGEETLRAHGRVPPSRARELAEAARRALQTRWIAQR